MGHLNTNCLLFNVAPAFITECALRNGIARNFDRNCDFEHLVFAVRDSLGDRRDKRLL